MNNIEIKHLRMICAIADTANMTKAAERLFLSQSALSQQLKDIEAKLGVELFLRLRKKMTLSRNGSMLLPVARNVLAEIESAELDIARNLMGQRGELKVGTQCIFCYKWLPGALAGLHRKFPQVELSIGNCGDVDTGLDEGGFDLVISGAASRNEKNCSEPLFEDQLVCVMNTGHYLATRNHVEYADFGDSNFITHAERGKNRFFRAHLEKRGIEPKKIMPVGAPQAIIEMVAAGFGLAIFPKWALSGFSGQVPVIWKPITARGCPMTWHAIYPHQAYQPLFLQEFVRIIRMERIAGLPE